MNKKILQFFLFFLLMISAIQVYALEYTQRDLNDGLQYLLDKEKKLSKKLNYRYLESSAEELKTLQRLSNQCLVEEQKKLNSLEKILNQPAVDAQAKTVVNLEINLQKTQKRLALCQQIFDKSKHLIILTQEQLIQAKDYKESGNYRMSLLEVIRYPNLWQDKASWKNPSEVFANEIFVIKEYPVFYLSLIIIGLIFGLLSLTYLKKYFMKWQMSYSDWLIIPFCSSILFFYAFLKYETSYFLVQPKLNWILENLLIYCIMSFFGKLLIIKKYKQQGKVVIQHLQRTLMLFLRSLLFFSLVNFVFIECFNPSGKEEFYYFLIILFTAVYFPLLGSYVIFQFSQQQFFNKNQFHQIQLIRKVTITLWTLYFIIRTLIIVWGYQWFTTLQLVFIVFLIGLTITFIRYLGTLNDALSLGKTKLAKTIHQYCSVDLGKDIYEFTGMIYIVNILMVYLLLLFILDLLSIPPYYLASLQKFVLQGFHVGSAHIIPINFIYALLVLIIGSLVGKYICYILVNEKNKSKTLDLDRKMTIILLVKYLSFSISLLIALLVIGVSSAEISVIIGGIGVGLGMGLRDLVMDFIAGMLILFQKTIHIGDYVSIDNHVYSGQVLKIMPLNMQILLADHTTLYIPNSYILKYSFTNHSSSNEMDTCFFLFKIKSLNDYNHIEKSIMNYLNNNKNVMHHAPYQPQLKILNMQNWEKENQYTTIHLKFNLNQSAEKNIALIEIKNDLDQLLKKYIDEKI